jgi:hypothetical protein
MKKQQQQVPDELEVIISEENIRQALKKNIEEIESQVREKERLNVIKKEWRMFLAEAKPLFPKMLHRYIAKARTEEQWRLRNILFHVPGLSPFWAEYQWNREQEHYIFQRILVTGIFDGDPQESPRYLSNWGQKFDIAGLPKALAYARNEYLKYESISQKRAERLLENRRSERDSARRNRENENKAIKAEEQRRSEEQVLFDSVKSDPVAIQLLKAILLIREERITFTEQLENAESWAETSERRMAEKLRLAKEDVDRAHRDADDERRRKEDLQDELDKAEKKAKRG